MDLQLDETNEALRRETQDWVASSWPLTGDEAALPEAEQATLWKARAIEAGFLHRTIPSEYGGGGLESDILAETVIRQVLDEAGAPHRGSVQGTHMLVPTLIECGTEAQRQRYIRPTLVGEMRWCQGYSEPGSGSDLASLQSRAVLEGDEWVINGQKIWTTQATQAEMMFGLFRTEPEATKHAGISYILLSMDTPGIDPRPLKMMQGGEDFCEVFFNDVRVPAENLVGKRGEGWRVSRSTLKHERMLIGDSAGARIGFDALLELARRTKRNGRPALEDPHTRQRIAELEGFVVAREWSTTRIVSAIAKNQDMKAMDDMLMAKIASTHVTQLCAKLAIDLIGDRGLEEPQGDVLTMGGGRHYDDARWVSQYMLSLSGAIAGGSSNIQRNIIGERLYGLPRDQRPEGH
jgi:alkylation response protein AidB-like acyl-CoA dehydrogenase